MRQLLLLRHAKSAWDDPRAADHERGLDARGRANAAAMGEAMRRLDLLPDLVLVSTAVRTLQTLAALEPWAQAPLVERLEVLYLATAPQIFKVLNAVAATVRSVLVIGHNPGLHDCAVQLSGMPEKDVAKDALVEKFPTAALAEFACPGPWRSLAPGGATLVRFIRPRDL